MKKKTALTSNLPVPTQSPEIRGIRRMASSSDGDTIHVSDFTVYRNGKPFKIDFPAASKTAKGYLKIRVLGIDAPELHYPGPKECRVPSNRLRKPNAPKIVPQDPWGTAAKDWLDAQLPEGERVIVELDTEIRDKYDRVLGYLWSVKGKWKKDVLLNAALVEKGHAFPYQIYPNRKYFRVIKEAAQTAGNIGVFKAHSNTLLSLAQVTQGKALNEPFLYRKVVDAAICQDVAIDLLTKPVGDVRDMTYHMPKQYAKVPIEYRLYFLTEQDAKNALFKKA